jgi:hypothetical protein
VPDPALHRYFWPAVEFMLGLSCKEGVIQHHHLGASGASAGPGYPLQFLSPLDARWRGSSRAAFSPDSDINWRYAVPHWFSIHTLRVRIRAWGFRYFRFYPLRCPKLPSMAILGFGFASQTQGIYSRRPPAFEITAKAVCCAGKWHPCHF